MATKFYPNTNHATLEAALLAIGEWFCGGVTGPGWTLIGAYSSNNAAFETPVAGNSLSALPAGNGWKEGVLVVGDYVLLETTNATSGVFQVGFEYQGATTWRIILAPSGGFNVGGAVADMTDAGNWTNPKLTTLDLDITGTVALGRYTVKADDDHCWIKYYDTVTYSTMRTTYIGNPEDHDTTDTHPALLYYGITENAGANNSGYADYDSSYWRKISPSDGTTEISLGCTNFPSSYWVDFATGSPNYAKNVVSGKWDLFPIYLYCLSAAYMHRAGKLRGVYFTNKSIGFQGHGVLANKDYAWHKNYSESWAPIITEWDGTTALGN